MKIQRIVHATDFSKASRPALGLAIELARAFKAELILGQHAGRAGGRGRGDRARGAASARRPDRPRDPRAYGRRPPLSQD